MVRGGMADTPWVNLDPFDLLGRVEVLGRHDHVIDWGCGKNESPISLHVKDIECEDLISVDAWPENILEVVRAAKAGEYKALAQRIERREIRVLLGEIMDSVSHKAYFSLCLDIVEHFEKPEAVQFLADLERISKVILIWIPLGPAIMEKDWWGQNHYWQTHRSQWTKEDLESLGYACEVLENFHTPMFNTRVDGCWACKEFV